MNRSHILAFLVGYTFAAILSTCDISNAADRKPGEWLDDNAEYGEAIQVSDKMDLQMLTTEVTPGPVNCVYQMQCTEHTCEICANVYQECESPYGVILTYADIDAMDQVFSGNISQIQPSIRLCDLCRAKYLVSYDNAMSDARKQWLDKARVENKALIKANTQRIKQEEIKRVRDQIDGLEKRLDELRGGK